MFDSSERMASISCSRSSRPSEGGGAGEGNEVSCGFEESQLKTRKADEEQEAFFSLGGSTKDI